MSKARGKYKGVRYITGILRKYQPKKYVSYKQTLPAARDIKAQLDSLDLPVQVKTIRALLRTGKTGRKAGPYIDPKLLQESYYFELVDYPVYIVRCSNELWFKSKLFPHGLPEIQGGGLPDYKKYFAPFVNYCNSMAELTDPEDKRYDTEWNVKCTVPVYNKSKKRWETEIISVDSRGNEFNYGFNPKKADKEPKSLILTQEKEKVEKKIRKGEEKPEAEEKIPEKIERREPDEKRVKEIKGLIADLRQDVKDGLISKEDYSKMVKDLISKLEQGGEV